MKGHLSLILVIAACASGCTHSQLRWNTAHQGQVLTDIYERQVLSNLAMFVYDPNSLPSFAFPNQGSSQVLDTLGVQSGTTWNAGGFLQTVLTPSASRGMTEAWTLTPVFDPRRLELMRCAYQQAVAGIGRYANSGCPNCEKLQSRFYTGKPGTTADVDAFTARTGITTPSCLEARPWFGWGCKKCVPNCKCIKVGHYCGMHVWVLPEGQDELSKLTLMILDYAFNTPAAAPAPASKEVTWWFDNQGLPTTKDRAVQEIHAVVPFDKKVRFSFNPPEILPEDDSPEARRQAEAQQLEMQLQNTFEKIEPLPPTAPPFAPPVTNPLTPLQLQQSLQSLSPQFGAGS